MFDIYIEVKVGKTQFGHNLSNMVKKKSWFTHEFAKITLQYP